MFELDERQDKLIELLDKQEKPVTSMAEIKTILEHPDNDMFNSWMEAEAKEMCYNWRYEKKR